jgi:hypothetical protein
VRPEELLLVLLVGLRPLVVCAQEPFDALVVDGLPVIETLRVPGQENLHTVAGTVFDLVGTDANTAHFGRPGSGRGDKLAALYHERWEIGTVLDELKTQYR